jgi:hypothetical protein
MMVGRKLENLIQKEEVEGRRGFARKWADARGVF